MKDKIKTEERTSDWVKKSTTAGAYETDARPSDLVNSGIRNYSYQWWLLSEEEGDYFTWGKGGQHIYVNPNKEIIMVRLGKTDGGIPWPLVFQELAEVVQ